MQSAILISATLITSLLAGIFLAYEISINPALKLLPDHEYIRTMQAINRVIQNPLFFIVFIGPVALLPLSVLMLRHQVGYGAWLMAAASVLYIFGTFGITVTANVPLNDKLDKIVVESLSPSQAAAARQRYARPWNRLHTVRTWLAIAAATLCIAALLI